MTAPEVAISFRDFSVARGSDPHTELLLSDLTLDLHAGEVLALVGESGSGKSLSAVACLGLLPDGVRRSGGSLSIFGQRTEGLSETEWHEIRGSQVSMVFQDPMTSLDPCFTVGSQIVETIRAHRPLRKAAARTRALEVMEHVGIPDPSERFDAYPHELSGGLRQRAMIAAALVMEPRILIADEPTTALDVTTQASIVELIGRLQRETSMSVLWISHDLGVVASLADRVAVLYAGELIELATSADLFRDPQHPYTMGLIDSAQIKPAGESFGYIAGSVPEPGRWPSGCRFSPRCRLASSACDLHPAIESLRPGRHVRCVHAGGVMSR